MQSFVQGVVKTELTRHKNGSWSAAAANLIYVSWSNLFEVIWQNNNSWDSCNLLLQAILSPALKSPRAGAQTSIFCAVDESLKDVSSHDDRMLLLTSKFFLVKILIVYFFWEIWQIFVCTNRVFFFNRNKRFAGNQSFCFMKFWNVDSFPFFRFPASTLWTATRARWPSRARTWRLPQDFGRKATRLFLNKMKKSQKAWSLLFDII